MGGKNFGAKSDPVNQRRAMGPSGNQGFPAQDPGEEHRGDDGGGRLDDQPGRVFAEFGPGGFLVWEHGRA